MKENCTSQFHLGRAMYEDFVLSRSHLLKQSSNILEEVSCSLQHVPYIGPHKMSQHSLSPFSPEALTCKTWNLCMQELSKTC
jgi:hypothetical protein